MLESMKGAIVAAVIFCVSLLGGHVGIHGQASSSPEAHAAPAGQVLGSGNFSPIVASLERTIEFYALFGLESPPARGPGPRPFSVNPRLHQMLGTVGAKERHVSAKFPGLQTGLEPIEFQDIDRKPVHPRIQDPGSVTLVLLVRDIDTLLAKLKKAAVPVITPGGVPIGGPDSARAVLVRDPDSRFVELLQPASPLETTAPISSDVIGVRLSMAVQDTERTLHTYRDLLGFKVESARSFSHDDPLLSLAGLKGAQVRRSRAQAPGSPLWIEFLEFKGIDRAPMRTRIQDPGSARLQLRVRNVDAILDSLKTAGSKVVSEGGHRVGVPPNLWAALVTDPDNLFLTVFEPCDGCALRPQPAAAHQP